jgi:hypothetical protein
MPVKALLGNYASPICEVTASGAAHQKVALVNKFGIFLAASAAILIGTAVVTRSFLIERPQTAEEIADPNVPPVLTSWQKNPSWNVGTWVGVDRKTSDCATADEFMDKGATERIVRRRGSVRRYYLANYVRSCAGVFDSMVRVIEPQARKWCAYRTSDPRLDELCRDWETNMDAYRARFLEVNGPTLRRYEAFIGGELEPNPAVLVGEMRTT